MHTLISTKQTITQISDTKNILSKTEIYNSDLMLFSIYKTILKESHHLLFSVSINNLMISSSFGHKISSKPDWLKCKVGMLM